jgi:hypothetical protein
MCAFVGLSFLWACYAVRRQVKLHGWSWWRVPLVAAVNFAACPLCIVIATARGE